MIERINSENIDGMKRAAKNRIDQEFIQKILKYTMANINRNNFGVEDLSANMGMSRSNLFRKVKAVTGQTPVEFIFSIRMKRSLELLIEQKLNISEIAFQVGFENVSSFSRAFKKQYGMPPSDFGKAACNSGDIPSLPF